MIRKVPLEPKTSLSVYEAIPEYQSAVSDLKAEFSGKAHLFRDRTIWMVNSTDQGGGVAEMLPGVITILRDLGFSVEWAVIHTKEEAFFHLTKKIHNMIHGGGSDSSGASLISEEEKRIYENVNRENADSFRSLLKKKDILIVHDPQPMGMGSLLSRELSLPSFWRSHIGTDIENESTLNVWKFLEAYSDGYEHGVFTAPEYIPSFFAKRASLIHPAIDPLSRKNRPLSPHRLSGILNNSSIERSEHPVLTPDFSFPAKRLQPDGSFQNAYLPESTGLMFRPIITQISRWDRLKGFQPLVEAFVILKKKVQDTKQKFNVLEKRRLQLMRLVIAGPDPSSIQDDPEGKEVLSELIHFYCALEPSLQKDISFFALPMDSLEQNALIVNSLQRCSTIVVQNSFQEGFGLTITEAMWKEKPILSTHAVGPRQQIRDHQDGRLVHHPDDPQEIAQVLEEMLKDSHQRTLYGESSHHRVYQDFLVFRQVMKWIRVLSESPQVAG